MEDAAYRQFVELEERHFWFVGRRRIFMHLLEHELAGHRNLRILDVGCGHLLTRMRMPFGHSIIATARA